MCRAMHFYVNGLKLLVGKIMLDFNCFFCLLFCQSVTQTYCYKCCKETDHVSGEGLISIKYLLCAGSEMNFAGHLAIGLAQSR